MGVKKDLEAAAKAVTAAIKAKDPATTQKEGLEALKFITNAKSTYEQKSKKAKESLKKLDGTLDKVKAILESPPVDADKALKLIQEATKAVTVTTTATAT